VVIIKWVPVEIQTQSEREKRRLALAGSRFLGHPGCSLTST